MKTVTITKNLYNFEELDEQAKEYVRQWYLDDPVRVDIFTEDITEAFLKEEFPKSNLDVQYSLSYCQGDGLNIFGALNLYDFLPRWEANEKEKKTIEFYIDNSIQNYYFTENKHYNYSCKFLDRKNIDVDVSEFCESLYDMQFKNIKTNLIARFFNDIIDYFEELDRYFEKSGYKWFYEVDDEEIKEFCQANEWFFTEDGKLY